MKGTASGFAAILAVLSLAPLAGAASVDERQARQEKRIDQGIESGALTRREAARLEREQARINRMEDRFRADGELSKAEKARLHRRLNRASRHIYREKHDAQKR